VKPGMNCIFAPSEAAKFKSIQARHFAVATKKVLNSPWRFKSIREKKSRKKTLRKKCSVARQT